MPATRAWCAKAKWPDTAGRTFKPFLLGTVFAEQEHEAERALKSLWDEICPYPVEWLAFLPGQLVFLENT